MSVPRVVATPEWTLEALKDALIAEFPFLATEEGLTGELLFF